MCLASNGVAAMYSGSTLSRSDAVSAVELFEQGLTGKSVALALDLALNPVQMLYERWQVRGSGALMTRERKQYDVETKLEIVRRHLQGVSGRVLAEEHDLPSPGTVANWTSIYRREGEDGLRPKKRGRPPADRGNPPAEGEVEQLRRENERLRAEVAYLGKLRALRSQERR
jgi:transposase